MLKNQINSDLKNAMKSKDIEKLSVLRMLVSAFENEAIGLKKKEQGLTEEEELKVLKREAKKRKDSIGQYESGGRSDLADKEKLELEILQKYLPEEMSQDEIKKIATEVITEMDQVAPSQFGQVMGAVMGRVKGKADGAVVSRVVKEVLK